MVLVIKFEVSQHFLKMRILFNEAEGD